MRTILFLLLSWALSQPCATAQTRAAGPWQVVNQAERYKLYNSSWGDAADWGTPDSSARKTTQADTVTAVRVRRKVIQVPWNVHPDSITLFLDCQNPLTVPHKQLAALRFKALGATVRLDAKQHLLLLVPSAPMVLLWAYRGQQLVFRHKFKAVPPPPPILKCFTSGGLANICKGPYEQQRHIRTTTLKAIPDPDFATILPEDARYRVARFRATLLRQGKAVELAPGQLAEKTVQGPQADMSDLTSTSQLGDQLQVDVLLVQRRNSLGIITEVPVTQRFIVNDIRYPKPE